MHPKGGIFCTFRGDFLRDRGDFLRFRGDFLRWPVPETRINKGFFGGQKQNKFLKVYKSLLKTARAGGAALGAGRRACFIL